MTNRAKRRDIEKNEKHILDMNDIDQIVNLFFISSMIDFETNKRK